MNEARFDLEMPALSRLSITSESSRALRLIRTIANVTSGSSRMPLARDEKYPGAGQIHARCIYMCINYISVYLPVNRGSQQDNHHDPGTAPAHKKPAPIRGRDNPRAEGRCACDRACDAQAVLRTQNSTERRTKRTRKNSDTAFPVPKNITTAAKRRHATNRLLASHLTADANASMAHMATVLAGKDAATTRAMPRQLA